MAIDDGSSADGSAEPATARDRIVFTRHDDPLAAPLVEALALDYDARYEPNDGVPSSFELYRYPASVFTPEEGGAFLVIVRDGTTIAGGAYKRIDETTAEIKRVWTHDGFRRQGLARRVMQALEAHAAEHGYRSVELTTGARQPEAFALYRALGYEPLFDLDGDFEAISYLTFRRDLD